MERLSVSRAWSEATAFVGREFKLLFPIAFLLMALPGLLLSLAMPAPESAEMFELAMFVQRIGAAAFIVIMIAVALVMIAFQTYGSLAIAHLVLRPGTSVGESLSVAARRLPSTFGAVLMIAVCVIIALIGLALLLNVTGAYTPGRTSGVALLSLVMALLFTAMSARMFLITPAAAAEGLGPIGLIARSWQLTSGHFWKLFGALLLLGIAYLLVASVIGLIFGFIIIGVVGNPLDNATAAFVLDLLNSLFMSAVAVVAVSLFARIYAQLSGRTEELAEVFT